MKKVLFWILLSFFTQQTFAQKSLKVWIVRHAEKDTTNVNDADPELSVEGAGRAEALMKELKGKNVDSIFVTDYKRAKLTAFPLSDKLGLPIKIYDAGQQKEWVQHLLTHADGKKILIVGHSDTILELITAFGVAQPVAKLTEQDYDYLFEINVNGKKTTLNISHYGAHHHQTVIK